MNKREKLNKTIRIIRTDFNYMELDATTVDPNPLIQFEKWMAEVLKKNITDANAVTLATVDDKGFPNARVVLLRSLDADGFSFFTNYKSAKGKELQGKKACLNFFWAELTRQVRVVGIVNKLSSRESDDYFSSRPRASQIGAWASSQSTVIKGRQILEENVLALESRFAGKEVPRPHYWGGYSLKPSRLEFWQGRPNRLHDRIQYRKSKNGKWIIERLAP